MSRKVKCGCCGKEICRGDIAYRAKLLPRSDSELEEVLCAGCTDVLVDSYEIEAELEPFTVGSNRGRRIEAYKGK